MASEARTHACCDMMTSQLEWSCDIHATPEECPDCIVRFYRGSSLFGIPIHDGGSSFIAIRHCPWCGADLGSLGVKQTKLSVTG